MTDKLPSFLKGSDPQRGQSGKNHLREGWGHSVRGQRRFVCLLVSSLSCLRLTFLKTMGSSSHTGLMALLFWEVLVFSAFLLVSAGSPNMSTSTYTPTRRSVRNWPEITYRTSRDVDEDKFKYTYLLQQGQFTVFTLFTYKSFLSFLFPPVYIVCFLISNCFNWSYYLILTCRALTSGLCCSSTFTDNVLATMPSTVFSVNGSKCLSGRLMNSGFSL